MPESLTALGSVRYCLKKYGIRVPISALADFYKFQLILAYSMVVAGAALAKVVVVVVVVVKVVNSFYFAIELWVPLEYR